jgi:DtxR family Mn-dependent transcriptional regulator
MEPLTSTVEEYLEKLFWMNEASIDATQANLARAVGVSQPTALEMVRRLTDDGLVVRDERKRLEFTDEGEALASRIVTRHRLIEAFLVQVFGIPWDEVHEEAHSFEHGISENLEERMRALLVNVSTCPHGHPIGDAPREPGVPLVTVPVGSTVRVLRHENEAEELLHAFKLAGIEPGDSIEITGLTGEELELQTPAQGATTLSIPESRAVTVAVESSGDGPVAEVDVPGAAVALHTSWGR